MDSRSCVAKAVVYGGLFKSGNDLFNATNAELSRQFLGNRAMNAMWAKARAAEPATRFKPQGWGAGGVAPGEAGYVAPAIFTRFLEEEKDSCMEADVAVFNYYPLADIYTVSLSRLPLANNISCTDV